MEGCERGVKQQQKSQNSIAGREGNRGNKRIATVSTNGLLSTMKMALVFYRINTDENTN